MCSISSQHDHTAGLRARSLVGCVFERGFLNDMFLMRSTLTGVGGWINTGGALPNSELVKSGKSSFSQKLFFGHSGWNWGGLGVSGGSARSIRRHSVELCQDLVLHGIKKSTFQHCTVNWNLNSVGMAFKTFHIVHGLSRTPLLFIPRYLTTRFPKHISRKKNIENCKFGSLTNQV